MGALIIKETGIDGLRIIEPVVLKDARGYFFEAYHYNNYKRAGINSIFVQDNQSQSVKGVLRGLHYQIRHPQAKLVRVISGQVFDVAVDIRKDSPTFKKWYGIVLSSENKKQLYIPEGFAHGFLVLSSVAELFYKCTNFYHPEDEGGISWNDPEIGIKWPLTTGDEIIMSDKDEEWPNLTV